MKKAIYLLLIALGISSTATAQLSRDSKMMLDELQDSLIKVGEVMVNDTNTGKRVDALHKFIPLMTRALKIEGSFYYSFDSLQSISHLFAPDSSFKILTWQLYLGKGINRYYGTVQMKGDKLKMFPLFDTSDTMEYHNQTILNKDSWYGALYYKILKNYAQGKYYYTLLGYDAGDLFCDRKIIDVLWFQDGYPMFGAPLFKFKNAEGKTDIKNRIFIDYKFDALASLGYDTSQQMIIYDHTAPTDSIELGLTFSYVPDGTYEGFKFENGFWNWIEKVFTFAINENDHPPLPRPLFDKTKDERFR